MMMEFADTYIFYQNYDYHNKGVNLMNYNRKISMLDDLQRIKSGYMPKDHFMFLYDTAPFFIALKLFFDRIYRNSFSGHKHSSISGVKLAAR